MSTDAELRERLTVANERLVDALLMFESEDARLSHLADVIDELAGALRAIDVLGAKLDPSTRLPASEPLSHELDRDGPRTPVLAWQGFDGRLRRYSRGAMPRPSIWPRWRMATSSSRGRHGRSLPRCEARPIPTQPS